MKSKVNKKEANNIISALEAGVVPIRGIRHLLVGRSSEVTEVMGILENVSSGNSDIRFWVGDFGSGKSFMLRTIESIALQKNFVVSTIDLTPTRRFYASDGKAKALYSEIVDNIVLQTSQDGNALNTILEEWLYQLASIIANEENVSTQAIFSVDYQKKMTDKILDVTTSFSSVGISFELGQAIVKYYEGLVLEDRLLKLKALRWIRGDIETKTESKRELGISKIINDDNWYEALKNLSELFASLGYAGLVINFDEAVNLYKLPVKQSREKNYEKILNIYNECKSNTVKYLFINFGATRRTVFDEYRGLASYGALKTRLGDEKAMDSKLINTNRTVLPLKPLTNEEIFTLLEYLISIYNIHYQTEIILSYSEIQLYMEEQLNRPGADEFLTPRAVIKDFIEILDLIRQNPSEDNTSLILQKFGKDRLPIEKDQDNLDDEIEVI
ncbi:ATP-binding protein [Vagococcus carniphilus]|uniref:Biotin carboxylase n=1 Tax=Vagococcus carniphilus TaxID=218144 RepID=A0A430B6V0_9ENTE|nr:ATP-binding protein [Vagococcus carniphilus]QNN72523.1 ATP-binding protein [Vagococcus carniphilus]RSU16029.1 biotin carboxylase [Vagococcus carniphilus]